MSTVTSMDTVTEGIDKVDISDSNDIDTSEVLQQTCAECGKQGINMNICNKCKSVTYCNAACKKKHRKKHKKACEKRVAELHEEQLFKDVEPDECPLCFQPMPFEAEATTFKSCCGKVICNGCLYGVNEEAYKRGKVQLCAFCRTPATSSLRETLKLEKKEMDKGNAVAIFTFGVYYSKGQHGMTQNWNKANELYLKAGELGCARGYYNLGYSYNQGYGVETDQKKARYYWELAAMNGHTSARHNLGCLEKGDCNYDRSLKHFIISAKAGNEISLDQVERGFMDGFITRDVYASTSHAYQERRKEMKSDMRDKAKEMGYGQTNR